MSNPNPPGAASRAPRVLHWIAWLMLAGYACFLFRNSSNVAGGADSSGYLNSAKLFASGRLTDERRTPPELAEWRGEYFQPLGFAAREGTRTLVPTYAPGLPLHFSGAAKLMGWEAGPLVVEVGAALGAVVLMYFVARKVGLDPPLALTAAITLGVFPVFVFTSIQPLSDTLATTWCLAAVAAALQSRTSIAWAGACGIAFAIAVLVRGTNIVIAPALIILMGWDWRRLSLGVLGGLPIAAWLAYVNHTLYGGAFRSGYGSLTEAFAWRYGSMTLVHFVAWLARLMPAVVLVLPIVAVWKESRRDTIGLLAWFGSLVAVYAFYEVSHEVWWCLRFILPGIPGLIIVALLAFHHASRRTQWVAAIAISSWAIIAAWFWAPRLQVNLIKGYEEVYRAASLKTRAAVPAHALVAACAPSGALFHYTDLAIFRWDLLPRDQFPRLVAACGNAQRPIFALLFDEVEDRAFRDHIPGEWTRVATVKNVSLWQLAKPGSAAGK